MKKTAVSIILTFMIILVLVTPTLARVPSDEGTPATKPNGFSNGKYIVQMLDQPVVSYTGGIPGYKATASNGNKIDPTDPDVQKYVGYLNTRHAAAAAAVGAVKRSDFVFTFNGFVAQLTPEQVAQLRQTSGVAAVFADELRQVETLSTPDFLGLTAPGGLWEQAGGSHTAGRNIVVGIVDSGLWPESPSFAYTPNIGPRPFARWFGVCEEGEEWTADLCNGKLLGARYFYGGWAETPEDLKALFPWEYVSARDADGHGSHTSSTAAGNFGVEALVNIDEDAELESLGQISGMAPSARVAMYKVCWGSTAGGCFSSDSVAAIDAAVADGVDVINFSISGSTTSFVDPVEQAFLMAARAGVFVAASAGNAGPGASTVAHNSPWLTTVAAGTHDRGYAATVTTGDAAVYDGTSLGNGTAVLPLIQSTAAGLPGADPTAVRLCFLDSLDPALVAGKIVLCDRGVNARVEKSQEVKNAGGLGMILANTSANSLNADIHYVPTVHVDNVVGAAIKAYIASAGAGATAQLSAGVKYVAEAPFVASFSSRGPARAGGGDLLKPDIMAPGVDILAAVSPAAGGRDFDFLSGTSMSSPHIAGLAAVIKQVNPTWNPTAIKSAMMTTASQTTNAGNPIPGNAFGYGAGQVTPSSATDPGLVYTSHWRDWVGFLCGVGQITSSVCPIVAIDPSNLNYASIAVGSLAGVQTVTRTVTNAAHVTETYTASVEGLAGFDVLVEPASFTLDPQKSQTFKVTFTTTTAPLNAYTFGAVVWTGDMGHVVRTATALRPVPLAAPGEVYSMSEDVTYDVTFGYTGDFTALPHGLVPATTFDGTVPDDPTNEFVPGGPGTVSFTVSVPAGTEYARFSLFDEYTDGDDDLDLFVYKGSTLVGSSGYGTSAEEVNLTKPSAGDYTIWVHGWQTDGADANFTLFTWALGAADAGNMTVTAPPSATLGSTEPITLSFSGLATDVRYLGTVTYHNVAAPSGYDDGRIGVTVVRVDTDALAAVAAAAAQPTSVPMDVYGLTVHNYLPLAHKR